MRPGDAEASNGKLRLIELIFDSKGLAVFRFDEHTLVRSILHCYSLISPTFNWIFPIGGVQQFCCKSLLVGNSSLIFLCSNVLCANSPIYKTIRSCVFKNLELLPSPQSYQHEDPPSLEWTRLKCKFFRDSHGLFFPFPFFFSESATAPQKVFLFSSKSAARGNEKKANQIFPSIREKPSA